MPESRGRGIYRVCCIDGLAGAARNPVVSGAFLLRLCEYVPTPWQPSYRPTLP